MDQAIHESVGLHAKNHRHDVLVIQLLLNNHLGAIGPRAKLSVDGVCGALTLNAIVAYQQRAVNMTHPDGVIYPEGRTLKTLLAVATVKHKRLVQQVHAVQKVQSPKQGPVANVTDVAPLPKPVAASLQTPDTHADANKPAGHKYTDSPMEMAKAATTVSPLLLPDLLQKLWPELNKDGARTITAQYMGETTGGKNCWNYNLGNVKCGSEKRKTHLHQYFPGTWEYYPECKANSEIRNNKNTRWPTADEVRKKVGKESGGKKMVIYKPPDISCCFLAYGNLNDGASDFVERYKHMSRRFPTLLADLNEGDTAAVAKTLHEAKYYTADQSKYAASMKKQKEYLDKTLGTK